MAQAYKVGVWTMVEVVELRANGGHVYLGVSERSINSSVLAKASAVIWQSTANIILAEFERATGAQLSRETLQAVKTEALVQLADAKRDVPAFWNHITLGTSRALRTASRDGDTLVGTVLERAQRDALRAKQATEDALVGVGTSARLLIREGATRAEALMREIAGQGPEKTLSGGFAIVRTQGGEPLTRATQVFDDAEIEIQFEDGRVAATAGKHS